MEIIIQPDVRLASLTGARLVAGLVRRKSDAVLGLATGSSPIPLYAELVEMRRRDGFDFSRIRTFNLDEYIGLDPEHPASYHAFMKRHLFDGLNVPGASIHIPDGLAPDVEKTCRDYEAAIRACGGIDLQVLGIGSDGHIGFNEPTSSLASRTRIKTLTERTRRDNAAAFGGPDRVPCHVITMGIGTIMESRTCLLLAFGKKKAAAVAAAAEGPITAMVPASILQMHPRTIFLLDEEAASGLKRADYYRWVYDHKPAWQKG
ncbi:MAG: glucosamine-6-phosphate deaminase [Acidobacteriota bacterium]|nr:glucosamine-6-phosphate deaminase [Acidobacteriota bacterium]